MAKRWVLYTGAPKRKDLSWKDEDLLVATQEIHDREKMSDNNLFGAWRRLELNPKHIESGLTQQHFPAYLHGPDKMRSHNTVDGGAILRTNAENPCGIAHGRVSFLASNASICVEDSFWSTSSAPSQLQEPPLGHVKITNLSELPGTSKIETIPYSHKLFSILVTILNNPTVQNVKTGKSNHLGTADLIRLVVADETRTAFEVSIWLNPEESTTIAPYSVPTLRNALELYSVSRDLRRGDIILVQNISLRVFRGSVSASSIQRTTSLALLYRPGQKGQVSPRYASARAIRSSKDINDTVLTKVRLILDWQDKFLESQPSFQLPVPDTG